MCCQCVHRDCGVRMRLRSTTKALYIQYTDATFSTPVARPAAEQYMGLLGPTLRANVGDVIKVVFRNKLR